MKRAVYVLAIGLLCVGTALAATAPAPLAAARQQVESADYSFTGRLVHVDEKGVRTNLGVEIKALGSNGALRILLSVNSPAQAREHVLMETHAEGKSTILVAHPGDKAASPLAFEKWNDEPLSGVFSFEDFLEAHYFWAEQTSEGAQKYGARDCNVLKSTAASADRTHYTEVKSWVDAKSAFPVHVEKTLKGAKGVKEFNYMGLEQREGIWTARQIEAKMRGHLGSTLLIIDRGSPRAHLDAKVFDPAMLAHF